MSYECNRHLEYSLSSSLPSNTAQLLYLHREALLALELKSRARMLFFPQDCWYEDNMAVILFTIYSRVIMSYLLHMFWRSLSCFFPPKWPLSFPLSLFRRQWLVKLSVCQRWGYHLLTLWKCFVTSAECVISKQEMPLIDGQSQPCLRAKWEDPFFFFFVLSLAQFKLRLANLW